MNTITIDIASINDAKEILNIYTPYILKTPITFEYDVPSLEEFQQRITTTLKNYPYIVARIDNKIVGYAYTSAFKQRAAYNWAVETSIYIDENYTGQGIGKALYQKLEEISKQQNIINMNACITFGNPESIAFHEAFGYQTVAHFHQCGYKFDQWYDMIWMEKMLGEHLHPDPFIPFSQLKKSSR